MLVDSLLSLPPSKLLSSLERYLTRHHYNPSDEFFTKLFTPLALPTTLVTITTDLILTHGTPIASLAPDDSFLTLLLAYIHNCVLFSIDASSPIELYILLCPPLPAPATTPKSLPYAEHCLATRQPGFAFIPPTAPVTTELPYKHLNFATHPKPPHSPQYCACVATLSYLVQTYHHHSLPFTPSPSLLSLLTPYRPTTAPYLLALYSLAPPASYPLWSSLLLALLPTLLPLPPSPPNTPTLRSLLALHTTRHPPFKPIYLSLLPPPLSPPVSPYLTLLNTFSTTLPSNSYLPLLSLASHLSLTPPNPLAALYYPLLHDVILAASTGTLVAGRFEGRVGELWRKVGSGRDEGVVRGLMGWLEGYRGEGVGGLREFLPGFLWREKIMRCECDLLLYVREEDVMVSGREWVEGIGVKVGVQGTVNVGLTDTVEDGGRRFGGVLGSLVYGSTDRVALCVNVCREEKTVDVNLQSGEAVHSGTVIRTHEDDSVDVLFDDGEKEERVPPGCVKRRKPITLHRREASTSLLVGDAFDVSIALPGLDKGDYVVRVEVQYRGKLFERSGGRVRVG